MNEQQWIKQMAERARPEDVPVVDVRTAVLARLAIDAPAVPTSWKVAAIASAVAAVIVVAFVGDAWFTLNDPFVSLMPSLDLLRW